MNAIFLKWIVFFFLVFNTIEWCEKPVIILGKKFPESDNSLNGNMESFWKLKVVPQTGTFSLSMKKKSHGPKSGKYGC